MSPAMPLPLGAPRVPSAAARQRDRPQLPDLHPAGEPQALALDQLAERESNLHRALEFAVGERLRGRDARDGVGAAPVRREPDCGSDQERAPAGREQRGRRDAIGGSLSTRSRLDRIVLGRRWRPLECSDDTRFASCRVTFHSALKGNKRALEVIRLQVTREGIDSILLRKTAVVPWSFRFNEGCARCVRKLIAGYVDMKPSIEEPPVAQQGAWFLADNQVDAWIAGGLANVPRQNACGEVTPLMREGHLQIVTARAEHLLNAANWACAYRRESMDNVADLRGELKQDIAHHD